MEKLMSNYLTFLMFIGLTLTANTCYERVYIEIANSQEESIICIINIYDTQSKVSQVFLQDTLKPKSRNGFFSVIYPHNNCAKARKIKYSDFAIISKDVICPDELVDRVYYYPRLKKMSKEIRKRAIIYLETLTGDTLLSKNIPLNELLSNKNEKGWIAI